MPGRAPTSTAWPKTGEDRVLHAHWQQCDGASLYYEVGIGGPRSPWRGSTERRLDGVLVHGAGACELRRGGAFRRDVEAAQPPLAVDVIEVKAGLSEGVVGQAIAGRWMFERQYPHLTVERNVVLYRHEDPAMRAAAEALGITLIRRDIPVTNKRLESRPRYRVKDTDISRVLADRELAPGLVMTRVPIGGEHSGVEAWADAVQTYVKYVRFIGSPSAGIAVFEGRAHFLELAARYAIEVIVTLPALNRGAIGIAKTHGLMLRTQYGVPEPTLAIVVEHADPALREVCDDLGIAVRVVHVPSAGVLAR